MKKSFFLGKNKPRPAQNPNHGSEDTTLKNPQHLRDMTSIKRDKEILRSYHLLATLLWLHNNNSVFIKCCSSPGTTQGNWVNDSRRQRRLEPPASQLLQECCNICRLFHYNGLHFWQIVQYKKGFQDTNSGFPFKLTENCGTIRNRAVCKHKR